MTRTQAIKLAIKSLRKLAHELAIDANLRADYGANYPAARRAHKERKRLLEAVQILEDEL